MTIDKIIDVDETDGEFHVRLTNTRTWLNPHLQYLNLKRNENKNILSEQEKQSIWMPWTVTKNVRDGEQLKATDRKSKLTIQANADFRFTKSDRTYLENTRLFHGWENYLHYTVEYLAIYICDYNMAWYPFDRQVCRIEFFQDEESIQIVPMELMYNGSKVRN